jgi:magnesium transporter
MKPSDLMRPDKIILEGFKSLSNIGLSQYSNQKSEAKAKSQLTFIGKKKMEVVKTQLIEFCSDDYSMKENIRDFSFINAPESQKKYWLNFHGIHDVDIIQQVGSLIGLDRLTIRQILDTTQRPKVESYEKYLFFSVKSIVKENLGSLKIEQLSFVLSSNNIVSFQEEEGDHFEGIRNKLVEGLGIIKNKNTDYLLGQLLDAILDNYFETIDKMNHEISTIEKIVLKNPDKSTLIILEKHKHSAQIIKKALRPFKEALLTLMDGEISLIQKENVKYFKDMAHSATSATEEIDATLKTLEGLTNIYFSSVSHKMNETMKVLTTVATIFIPLTFIVGIYGMNFDNMPELHHRYGYFIALGSMGLITVGMLVYFKLRKWM